MYIEYSSLSVFLPRVEKAYKGKKYCVSLFPEKHSFTSVRLKYFFLINEVS